VAFENNGSWVSRKYIMGIGCRKIQIKMGFNPIYIDGREVLNAHGPILL